MGIKLKAGATYIATCWLCNTKFKVYIISLNLDSYRCKMPNTCRHYNWNYTYYFNGKLHNSFQPDKILLK